MDPVCLGFLIAGSLLLVGFSVWQLEKNGWANPHALDCLSSRCQNSPGAQIPYIIQFSGIFFGACVLLQIAQFITLALNRFDDVVLEDGRLTHASHPWRRAFDQRDLLFVSPFRLGSNDWSKGGLWINVAYRWKGGQRGMTIMPWMYRESAATILSNFEAAGFEVRRKVEAA